MNNPIVKDRLLALNKGFCENCHEYLATKYVVFDETEFNVERTIYERVWPRCDVCYRNLRLSEWMDRAHFSVLNWDEFTIATVMQS